MLSRPQGLFILLNALTEHPFLLQICHFYSNLQSFSQ